MSLKAQLFFSFAVMVLLNVFLGIILISSSWNLRSKYIKYERQRELLDFVRLVEDNYDKQKRCIDGYMVGMQGEKDNFAYISGENEKILLDWKNKIDIPSEKEEYQTTYSSFHTYTIYIEN